MGLKNWLIIKLGGYTPQFHQMMIDVNKNHLDRMVRDTETWVAETAMPRLREGPRFVKLIRSNETFIAHHETRELLVVGSNARVSGTMAWGASVLVAPWARRCCINVKTEEIEHPRCELPEEIDPGEEE